MMTYITNINFSETSLKDIYKRSMKSIKTLFERSPKRDYFLKTKTGNKPISEFPYDSWAVSSGAVSYSKIEVGKKTNPGFKREITTFYDIHDRVITKCFNDNNRNYRIRNYKYKKDVTSTSDITNIREITTERYVPNSIPEYIYGRDLKTKCLVGKWHTVENEMQCVSTIHNGAAKKLSVLKTYYPVIENKRQFKVTEYPATNHFEPKNSKKEFSGDIISRNETLELENVQHSPNISIDTNDKFLPYRLLSDCEKCKELPLLYLKRHNLHLLGISIKIPSKELSPDTIAAFSTSKRDIAWRKVPVNTSIVNTSAHEAEHAYQHSQIGRLGKGYSGYEDDCRQMFGEITNRQEQLEAEKYAHARDIYPEKNDTDYDKRYFNNYLEECSRKAGKAAEKEYKEGQEKLKQTFKYFPDSINMF